MRWPWRRRAEGGRVVFVGTSPFDVQAAIAAVPTPSPAVAAWVPPPPPEPPAPPVPPPPPAPPVAETPPAAEPVAAPAAVAVAVAAPEPRAGVQLGFADGSVVTLDDDDPRAVALRAAAARLTGTS